MSLTAALVGGLAAGVGGAAFGSIFGDDSAQDDANAANQRRFGRALGEAETAKGFTDLAAQRIDAIFGKLPGLVTEGFDTARDELEDVGNASRDRIGEQGEQSRARQTQDASKRGFANSPTVTGAIERSTRFETNRALRDLDEGISLMRSGLATQRGLGIARAYEAQARGLISSTQMRRQASQTIIDLLGSVTDKATGTGTGSMLGSLFGNLAGQFVGAGGLSGLFGGGGGAGGFDGLTVPPGGLP